jgi:kynureninase
MFRMDTKFDPSKNAAAWQIGTINMLSTAPIEGSLKMILEAGIDRIRDKSVKITDYLIFLIDEMLTEPPYSYSVVTPRVPEKRGGHVGVSHKEGWAINQALIARGVIPDFRPPTIIRLAPIPLYVSYHDVWKVAKHLKEVIENGEHLKYRNERRIVT